LSNAILTKLNATIPGGMRIPAQSFRAKPIKKKGGKQEKKNRR
jgi:hypothetical protein